MKMRLPSSSAHSIADSKHRADLTSAAAAGVLREDPGNTVARIAGREPPCASVQDARYTKRAHRERNFRRFSGRNRNHFDMSQRGRCPPSRLIRFWYISGKVTSLADRRAAQCRRMTRSRTYFAYSAQPSRQITRDENRLPVLQPSFSRLGYSGIHLLKAGTLRAFSS